MEYLSDDINGSVRRSELQDTNLSGILDYAKVGISGDLTADPVKLDPPPFEATATLACWHDLDRRQVLTQVLTTLDAFWKLRLWSTNPRRLRQLLQFGTWSTESVLKFFDPSQHRGGQFGIDLFGHGRILLVVVKLKLVVSPLNGR